MARGHPTVYVKIDDTFQRNIRLLNYSTTLYCLDENRVHPAHLPAVVEECNNICSEFAENTAHSITHTQRC